MLPVITHPDSVTGIKSSLASPPRDGASQAPTIYLDSKSAKANILGQLAPPLL